MVCRRCSGVSFRPWLSKKYSGLRSAVFRGILVSESVTVFCRLPVTGFRFAAPGSFRLSQFPAGSTSRIAPWNHCSWSQPQRRQHNRFLLCEAALSFFCFFDCIPGDLRVSYPQDHQWATHRQRRGHLFCVRNCWRALRAALMIRFFLCPRGPIDFFPAGCYGKIRIEGTCTLNRT